jgi:hypothetical protein
MAGELRRIPEKFVELWDSGLQRHVTIKIGGGTVSAAIVDAQNRQLKALIESGKIKKGKDFTLAEYIADQLARDDESDDDAGREQWR